MKKLKTKQTKNKKLLNYFILSNLFISFIPISNAFASDSVETGDFVIFNKENEKLSEDDLKNLKLKDDDYKKIIISDDEIDDLLSNNKVDSDDDLLKENENKDDILVSIKQNSGKKENRVEINKNKKNLQGISPAQIAMTATLANLKSTDISVISKNKTNGFESLCYILNYSIQNKNIDKTTALQIIALNDVLQKDIIKNKESNEYSYLLCSSILETLSEAFNKDFSDSDSLLKIFKEKLDKNKISVENIYKILNPMILLYQNKDLNNKSNEEFFEDEAKLLDNQDGFSTNKFFSMNMIKKFFISIGLISKEKLKEEQIITTDKPYHLIPNNINYKTGSANSSLLLEDLENNTNQDYFNTYDGMATFTYNELKNKKWYFEERDQLGRTRNMTFLLNKNNIKKLYNYIPPKITPSGFSNSNLSFKDNTWSGKNENKDFMSYGYYIQDNPNAILKLTKKAYKTQEKLFKEFDKECQSGNNIVLKITPLFNRTELSPDGIHYVAKSLNSNYQKNIVINNKN